MTESFGKSDFWVESMSCSSLGKLPSRTKVLYWDRETLEKRPAFACDPAVLWKQGSRPVIQELDYSNFICLPALAAKIAAREQQTVSAMPKTMVLRALRTMAHLKETDQIQISYPDLNIASMYVRVAAINRGSLVDGECVIQVIEDVFMQGYTTYAVAPGAGVSGVGATVDLVPFYEAVNLADSVAVRQCMGLAPCDSVGVNDSATVVIV